MKTNAARILDSLGIRYELRDYQVDEDDLSAPAVACKVGFPPEQVFKTLVCRGDKHDVCLAVVPADSELDLKARRSQMIRRVPSGSGGRKPKSTPAATSVTRSASAVAALRRGLGAARPLAREAAGSGGEAQGGLREEAGLVPGAEDGVAHPIGALGGGTRFPAGAGASAQRNRLVRAVALASAHST